MEEEVQLWLHKVFDLIVYWFCQQTILNMLSFRFREKQLWTDSYSLHVWSTIYKIPTNVVISSRQYKCFSRAQRIIFQSNHILASWKNWNAFLEVFHGFLKQSSWWKQSKNSLITLPCYKNATKIRSKIAYKTLEHFIPKEHCLYFLNYLNSKKF